MKQLITLLAIVFFSQLTIAQSIWQADTAHSSLNFSIKHSGISLVNGKFTDYTGVMTTNGSDLETAKFDFDVKVISINTNVEPRDNHLRSADFFEVEKYPNMTFKSTKVMKKGKENQYLLFGDLTIKGVTKPVVFDLWHTGTAKSDKGEKMGFKAKTTINRFDYNINYDPGAAGIGKEVEILVHLQVGKQ